MRLAHDVAPLLRQDERYDETIESKGLSENLHQARRASREAGLADGEAHTRAGRVQCTTAHTGGRCATHQNQNHANVSARDRRVMARQRLAVAASCALLRACTLAGATHSCDCCPTARTPASPTTPIARPAAQGRAGGGRGAGAVARETAYRQRRPRPCSTERVRRLPQLRPSLRRLASSLTGERRQAT